MKKFIFCLLFLTFNYSYSQSLSIKEINTYVSWVDSLRYQNKLIKYRYLNMSRCSGALKGYYYNNKLIYMSSVYGAETGYSSKDIYLKGKVIYKMRYREHYAEWEKHHQNFPNDEGFENMTYTDTLYTIFFSEKPLVYKTSGANFTVPNTEAKLLTRLLECAESMRLEMNSDEKKRG